MKDIYVAMICIILNFFKIKQSRNCSLRYKHLIRKTINAVMIFTLFLCQRNLTYNFNLKYIDLTMPFLHIFCYMPETKSHICEHLRLNLSLKFYSCFSYYKMYLAFKKMSVYPCKDPKHYIFSIIEQKNITINEFVFKLH